METEIISHRGNGFGFPENTFAAFQEAIRKGCSIELDIYLSKDKVPMITHFLDLDTLTVGDGNFSDHTAEELSKVSLKEDRNHKVISLSSIIEIVKNSSCAVYIHIKDIQEPLVFEKTFEVIEPIKDQCVFFSNDEMSIPLVKAIKEKKPSLKTALHLPEDSQIDCFDLADIVWVDETTKVWCTPELVNTLHSIKKKVVVMSPEFVPNSIFSEEKELCWEKWVGMGVDAICTDHPLELIKVIKEKQ